MGEDAENPDMLCPTPALPNIFETLTTGEKFAELSYGFIMDNVTALLNWSGQVNRHYTVYPDPVFERFPNGVKDFQSSTDYLILKVS